MEQKENKEVEEKRDHQAFLVHLDLKDQWEVLDQEVKEVGKVHQVLLV
jgi:hypothetical protein